MKIILLQVDDVENRSNILQNFYNMFDHFSTNVFPKRFCDISCTTFYRGNIDGVMNSPTNKRLLFKAISYYQIYLTFY